MNGAKKNELDLELPGAQADWPPLANSTIGQVLRETARIFPDHDAVIFRYPHWRRNWLEFDQEVDLVARALLASGLRRGDHFGIWATNVPEWVLLQFGRTIS